MIAIYSLISLSLLLFLIVPLWNQYRIEKLRQDLFVVRDRLFMEAANGHIHFDSHSYRVTRTIINGLIRFGHKASLTRIILIMLMVPVGEKSITGAAIKQAFDASPDADRRVCKHHILEANQMVARHLARSPYLMLILSPIVLLALLARTGSVSKRAVMRLKRQFRALDQAAYVEGRSGVGAHC